MPQVAGFVLGAFGWTPAAGLAVGAVASPFAAGWIAGAGFASTAIGSLAVKLLTSVAISALQQALEPSHQGGGITISATLRGEDNPETIILGRYATAGQSVYVNSHGTSRRWLTHVVEICSAPGATLNRLMLGDQWVTLAATPMAGYEEYGLPVTSEDYAGGYVFVKFYNGSQTVADPMLVAKYGTDPDRPWASTAVGTGLCYAILTFYHHAEILPQIPAYRFELDGIPLYDVRKDSTAGGSGPQRLATPSTWTQTNNPAVMIWNILRGIPLPGGEVWGGGFGLDLIPAAVWTAAMNRCDAPAAISGGGTEPSYRAGLEAALTQEPAATVTELLKACSGTIADMGYAWTIAIGAPALPVYAISDDDVIVSKSQTLDPFPSLADTYNAVSARYPSPSHLWESHEAPLRTDATAEASDVFGRRTASLTLPAAPYGKQVQRLAKAWLQDNRRFIRHIVNVPPDAAALDMADTLDWSSARNGYADKTFSLHEIAEDIRTCIRQVSIRERDPSDYDWDGSAELPTPPITVVTPVAAESVAGFAAIAATVVDANATARRAAIEIIWNPEIAADGLIWELRLSGQTVVQLQGDTQRVSDGSEILISGILPATAYQIRARLIASRKTDWTSWINVTTLPIGLGAADMSGAFLTQIESAGVKAVSALPAAGDKINQIVCLVPPGRFYRWTGSAWTPDLFTGIEPGSLTTAAFAAGIRPVEILTSLPTSGNFDGRMVYRTSDKSLWRHNGSAWVNTNAADQIVGQLTAAQIAAGAIGAAQIAARAVVASKLVVTDFANLLPNPEFNNSLDGWSSYGGGTITQYRGEYGVGLRLEKPVGVTAEIGVRETGWPAGYMTPVVAGERLRLKCKVRRIAGISGGTCSIYARLVYADGTTLGTAVNGSTGTTPLDTTVEISGEYTIPADVVGLTWQVGYGSHASSAGGVVLITDISIRRMAGGELIVEGSITGNHILAQSLDAAVIGAGKVTAEFLDINQMVAITNDDAGFSFGKTSPTDFSTDGLFMGKSQTSGGASGFGFLLGKTSLSGFDQSIQHTTEGGLKITNANFQFNAGSGTSSDITASQTVTLPVGTKTIDLSIVGGAGGGGAYNTTYTTSGGTTTVQLYDGSTNTGISWTAAGGLNGGRSSKVGQSSAYGTGGGGATWSRTWVGSPSNGDWSDVLSTSTPATGYGAGGGGGGGGSYDAPKYGKGGAAGATKTVTSYDVSALANPKLVITIGAGGSTGANKSSAGTGGIVKIATSTIVSVPANVVPLRPTASGTFVKAANATGDTVFPDLGPGLWIISGVNSELLCLNQLRITDTGPISVKGANARSMTFVADIRPNIIVGNATAVTIVYAFYSMKVVT